MSQVFTLPESLRLPNAVELKDALSPLLEAGGDIHLDASHISAIDTAGLQLLLCLQQTLIANGANLVLQNPSEALTRLATTAAVHNALDLPPVH